MKTIACPMCGKPNPPDLEICQFCDARLQPMTDELSRSQPPIHPGEEPTPKSTAELEPVLPKWLREVRQQAREAAEEETQQDAAQEEAAPPSEAVDWLAGLQSQPDEEEIPDWLANLRGGKRPDVKESPPAPSELPTAEEHGAETLPGWIADLGAAAVPGARDEPSSLSESPSASTPDMDWRAGLEADFQSEAASSDAADLGGDLPDWLKSEERERGGEPGAREQSEGQAPAFTEEPSIPSAEGLPDWLASLDQEGGAEPKPAAPPAFTEEPPIPSAEGLPDWLASTDQGMDIKAQTPAPAAFEEEPSSSESELPDWLAASPQEGPATPEPPVPAFTEEPSQPSEEVPDWLTSLELTVSADSEEPGSGETTDWLAVLGQKEQPSQDKEAENVPAFVDDEGAPIASGDVDAIFSMEMPDWLSEVGSGKPGEPAAETEEGSLSPAELPSWVRAMRPVEAVISEGETTIAEQAVEEKGPLAGLRGVLPLPSQVAPVGKPKPYSLKLQASEEQQNSASLLEQLLVGEAYPRPMTTTKTAFSNRLLRQLLALLILLAVGVPIFLNTNINPVPFSVTNETNAAKQFIEGVLPPDSTVLMVFDYEAALAGELEASAAPLIDYMVLLKHPRLCLLATTPIGAGLSERFMKVENTQVSTYYQAGQSYVNLGFLPGGAAGALAFAENPAGAKPLDVDGRKAWETPVLQGVQQLSQFAAVILLTDDAESARQWIEQTRDKMGQAPLLVISSAQAGPMLQPYVQSGQVEGLVVGLGSSAPLEYINGGRPGLARRYWDAYGMGLLAAMLLISVGAMWNLAVHWRSRQSERGV